MRCSAAQIGVTLTFLPRTLATYPTWPQLHQHFRQTMAEEIASAKADNLAHPRNASELIFGPQIYEAPLLCVYPEFILEEEFGVNLGRAHSIDEHYTVIANDVRPLIWAISYSPYLETVYMAKAVDEKLLRAIRSDPEVLLVTCNFREPFKHE